MKIRQLAIITHGYPFKARPSWFAFVRQFANAVARLGVTTRVITPLPVHVGWRSRDPVHQIEPAGSGANVEVWRPRYWSLSNRRFGPWNTSRLGQRLFRRAAARVLRRGIATPPDALYGHFLYRGGQVAVSLGRELGLPAFPMVGEGALDSIDPFGLERARRDFAPATAFMANSTCLGKLLEQQLLLPRGGVRVFPNGVDHTLFRPQDKAAMRRKFDLPQNAFIVICVAVQDKQKGPLRVAEAIDGVPGVGGVFLGAGPNPPECKNLLYRGLARHDEVPGWLAAADLFVLPTIWEGCCNAIIEAMACGLPVVSSEGEFNDDILNPEVSIRVDPLNVPAIRMAIQTLVGDPDRRQAMSAAALAWAARFDVNRRAQSVLDFMAEQAVRVRQG